jgi:gliding motility-associated-like protein
VGSVIDIPFYSTGIYNASNAYVCQLSEPDGTFSSTPPIVGSSPDASTYDPAIVPLPGSVSGIIPDTEPGCNYYLRIVSSNPSVIGTVWGPFCIQRCDVTTNNTQDVSVCISECSADPSGAATDIFLDVNTNNQSVTYAPGNVFTTQLFSSQSFTQIGSDGILGEVTATGDATLTINVPCLEDALALGIPTGMSYLRVISTNPSDLNNAVSSLIRITIGVESSVPITLTSYNYADGTPADTLCAPASIYLDFSPYDPTDGSTYMWSCSGINGGVPFESPNGPSVNFLLVTANAPTILDFLVQRTNHGCTGPWSPTASVTVTGPPVVFITGATQICLGDTVSYQVPFFGNTYYSWTTDAFPSELAFQDTSNNVLNVAFATSGSYTLSLNVLNQCGAGSDDFTLTVLDLPVADAGPDIDICTGNSATLHLTAAGSPQYQWSSDAGNAGSGNNVSVSPTTDTDYYGTVTTNLGCTDTDTMRVIIHYPDAPIHYTDSICPGGDNAIILESDSTGTYNWSTGSANYYTTVNDTGSYSLSVQTLNSICPHYVVYDIVPAQPYAPTVLTDSVCPGGSDYIVLRAEMQGRYEWNNGQVNAAIYVNYPGTYTLNIYANDAPCPHTQIFTITPDTCIVVPPDSIPYEEVLAWVPNAFTANQDGMNEVFAPVFSNIDLVRDYRLVIFDRWGTVVYESTDPHEKWTGGYQKSNYYVDVGVYTWLLYFRGAFEVNAKSTSGIVNITR